MTDTKPPTPLLRAHHIIGARLAANSRTAGALQAAVNEAVLAAYHGIDLTSDQLAQAGDLAGLLYKLAHIGAAGHQLAAQVTLAHTGQAVPPERSLEAAVRDVRRIEGDHTPRLDA